VARRLVLLSRNPEAHGVRRLQAAAGALGGGELLDPHAIRLGVADGKLTAWVAGTEPFDLTNTVVIPRIGSTSTEYSLAVLEHLEAGGARVLNPAAGVTKLRSKFNMLGYLTAAGIPVPDSAVLRMPAELEPVVARLGGWPVVLKFIRGSQGLGVALAQDESVAAGVIEALNFAQYDVLLQRYYPTASSDLRILVLGGRARWGVRRIAAEGKFRSNIHRGGRGEPLDLAGKHAPYARLAEHAAAVFQLGLAGVDLIDSEDGPVVLEVNASPGFEKPEELYGNIVAEAIVEYALGL
jgi:ribosomal protein S6--L-glutamate ligase